MSQELEKVFYDSSQMFYCSGKIGYRWAVKTIEIAAENLLISHTDTISLQEVLDFFHYIKDYERGEVIFKNVKAVMNHVLPVTVADFERSTELFAKYPKAHPRALLHSAVMKNNHIESICTTFATGYEQIPEVNRVNLMDKVKH
jgi:hypothetical protein